ncbi:uncharacterized protein M421DRAFT_73564 [Didymella exigua CBS 183.55]|uniref:Uncharacterized protein n=1 Tax=Didymella exigua CBS 183.55 TaxID=1150837 RepID=A0A6A5RAL4_9PLEO|nr:uncharacterized protein M421DRAFT_73564 [Didymella exigua CBS 183.55]KAF1924104.1 hypothetical protein M421DRAFT_73564 [Didymella exigua CBS 183.55]
MNNYSFLDSSTPNGMPRAPPVASPSQAGLNGAAQQNGIPMVNGLPSGGQQTDMNHLWAVVQQLAQQLEENKAQTQSVLGGVAALQGRLVDDSASGSAGGAESLTAAASMAERAALQARVATLEAHTDAAAAHTHALTALVTDYENALTLLLDKLRPYAYTHTSSILALHKHYHALLDHERNTSMQLRLEHVEWQAGLGRVAEYARAALKVQRQGEEGMVGEIRALKEENRVLRQLAGWEERADSSDEERAE